MVPILCPSPCAVGVEAQPVLPEGAVILGIGEVVSSLVEQEEIYREPLSMHTVRMAVREGGPSVTVSITKCAGITLIINLIQ